MLYHGSHYKIDEALKPFVSFHLKPLVYATSDYMYAVVRAGVFNIEEVLLREDYDGAKYHIAELQSNAFKRTFDTDGYVYCVGEDAFTSSDAPNEYVSNGPVRIDSAIYIPNIWDFMCAHKDYFDLIEYEDVDDEYWSNVRGGKAGYYERRLKNIKRIKEAQNA